MKLIRTTAALAIVAAIIVLVLRILGVLGDQQASETAGKVIAVLAVIGLGLGAVGVMLSKGSDSQKPPENKGQGPQF